MPPKKKTNFVSYELKKLEKYWSQLEKYMDDNPPDQAEDRLDVRYNERTGMPIVKTIATKESIVKLFKETFASLPKILEDLNSLRKSVNEEIKQTEVRGDQAVPGFMLLDNDLKKEEKDDEYVDDHFKEEKFDDEDEKISVPAVIEKNDVIDFTDVPLTNTEEESDDWYEEEDEEE